MTEPVSATTLEPYLPRLTAAWARERPDERVRELDATLVSVDLSGFTALSERLAAKGRAGSEELILVISGVFEGLIGITLRHGGDVLKFRGDALLILFEGAGHAERACRASVDMQWFIEHAGSTMSSVGPVSLRMSTGVHTGTVHAFLLDATHRELMVTGPATTATFRLEDASQAGEVLVSEATAAAVDPAWLGERREEGILLTLEAAKDDDAAGETPAAAEVDLEPYVPKALRAQLAFARGEAEHRQATVAFLKYAGIDDVIDAEGAEGALEQLQQIATVVSRVCDELDITWLESDIDVNAGKIYLTAGAPGELGRRRGAHAPRTSGDPRRKAPAEPARGRQPRPDLRRRHRRDRAPHLRGHGRRRQPRRPARRPRAAGRPARDRRGARPLGHAVRDRGPADPREGQGARGHGVQRRPGHRRARGAGRAGAARSWVASRS